MSRNLLQMTSKIFDEFAAQVSDEHKEYIASVNRHISISEENRKECCGLLKDAIIVGRRHEYLPTVVFIKYKEVFYVGIDTRYAEKFETFGYILEENPAIYSIRARGMQKRIWHHRCVWQASHLDGRRIE